MSLDHPLWLMLGIVLAAAFAFAYARLQRRKTAHDLVYSNITFFEDAVRPRAWIVRALQGAFALALALLALGASGPHVVLPVPVRDGAVFICIDTSGSMQSTDITPTRALASLTAARAFIAESPPGVKVGIISFATDAAIVQPLTTDHREAIAALANVPAPNGATSIGDALALASQQLPAHGHRVVVLVTDGVNNHGSDPEAAAQALGMRHIAVYTIGIGTPNGDVIPGTNEAASIDEDALRSYAQESGGAYARAENADQLREALARLGRVTGFERAPVDASIGCTMAGGLLAVLVVLAGLGLGRFP